MDGKVGGERRVAAAGSAKSISQNIVGGNGKTRYARVFYDSFAFQLRRNGPTLRSKCVKAMHDHANNETGPKSSPPIDLGLELTFAFKACYCRSFASRLTLA